MLEIAHCSYHDQRKMSTSWWYWSAGVDTHRKHLLSLSDHSVSSPCYIEDTVGRSSSWWWALQSPPSCKSKPCRLQLVAWKMLVEMAKPSRGSVTSALALTWPLPPVQQLASGSGTERPCAWQARAASVVKPPAIALQQPPKLHSVNCHTHAQQRAPPFFQS